MIFHFFFTHVGRSLLEGLQRGSWLSLHSHYSYLHVGSWRRSTAGTAAGTGMYVLLAMSKMWHVVVALSQIF